MIATCERCGGRVIHDARAHEVFCLACGGRVLSASEVRRAREAVVRRDQLGRGGRRERRPSTNGIVLD